MKYWGITILSLCFFAYSARQVSAEGILFQDDFNSGSLVNWHTVRNQQLADPIQPCLYQNETANWQINNGQLGINISGPNCTTEILPRFLDLTNIYSYQVDFDMSMNENYLADRDLLLSWQNDENWYTVSLFGQAVVVQKTINREFETLENSLRYPFWTDQTYHFTLLFRNNQEIILKINNLVILDFWDSPHTFTGFKTVGLQAGVMTVPHSLTYFDNFVVRSLDPGINLGVPILKQFDDEWGTEEYDSAKSWSDSPTIGTWGCSLTSMVMVMKYYGIDFLPNDQFLTPDTLNTWLKSQPDGYIGDGNLNWLAITRLTKLIYDRFHTPKLEFRRLKGDLELAKTEIRQERPVIIHINGHFLVGDGVTDDEQDILTKDPDFPYTHFQEYQTTPIAIETFTPSHTDLSYFFLAHPEGLTVKLINEQKQEVAEFEGVSERLQSFDVAKMASGSAYTKPIVEHMLAKPADGSYILEISSAIPQKIAFQFFVYDQSGSVTDLSQTTYFTQEPKYFLVTYAKNQTPVISPIIDFSTFHEDLSSGKVLGQISSDFVWQKLDEESSLAEFSGQMRQKRYFWEISALLEYGTTQMTAELFSILENDLKVINQQLNVIISR